MFHHTIYITHDTRTITLRSTASRLLLALSSRRTLTHTDLLSSCHCTRNFILMFIRPQCVWVMQYPVLSGWASLWHPPQYIPHSMY